MWCPLALAKQPSNPVLESVEETSSNEPTSTKEVCDKDSVCVGPKEQRIIGIIAREKYCQLNEPPEFKLDPIQLTLDKNGRVFFSGSEPRPYKLSMSWCNYEVEAKGVVKVITAMEKPPIWGLRLRPKAYMGFLPSEAFYDSETPRELGDYTDAGFMIDFLYYDWVNLNLAVGYRSIGGGLGVDLTENFGLYVGYSSTWGNWHHGLTVGAWFSFWNP